MFLYRNKQLGDVFNHAPSHTPLPERQTEACLLHSSFLPHSSNRFCMSHIIFFMFPTPLESSRGMALSCPLYGLGSSTWGIHLRHISSDKDDLEIQRHLAGTNKFGLLSLWLFLIRLLLVSPTGLFRKSLLCTGFVNSVYLTCNVGKLYCCCIPEK